MRNGRMSVIGALVVASAVLTACQGATSPGESSAPPPSSSAPPSSAAPSASPSPTPKHADENGPGENLPVPKLPDAAKEHTEKGAAAFVEFYFDLANYSSEVRDTTELERFTSKDCNRCEKGLLEPIWLLQDTESWEVGLVYKAKITKSELRENNRAQVIFSMTYSGSKVFDGSNGPAKTFPAREKPILSVASLVFHEGRWITETVVFDGQEPD
ncbi:DUF6318 family protein [Glutamicibacter sp. PS]|uniref:DUF6318 family protein n=1 Tax=Glutamicibacter sp. PS TaxID=3075634 RepID=UPI00284092FB|nr:DUF6318 family protein [Glutamicibacter sp. PS]MDR4531925.1 DUF6318 family protein [Glutamicibacter sp. PS]